MARRAARGARPGGRRRWPTPSANGGRTRTRSTTATPSGACCADADPPAPPPGSAARRGRRNRRPRVRTRCRCCAPTRPSDRRTRSRPRASGASPAATSRRCRRARRLVYLEDQYFWSRAAAHALADALRAHPELRVVVVVPRYPDRDGRVAGPAARIGRAARDRASSSRPAATASLVCDLENDDGHADLRARQGLHRRRRLDDGRLRQHEPPLVDPRLRALLRRRRRRRSTTASPRDPAGLGRRRPAARPRHPASALARAPRPHRSHRRRRPRRPRLGLRRLPARRRRALDAWHDGGRAGPRPAGTSRLHRPEHVPARHAWWARAVCAGRERSRRATRPARSGAPTATEKVPV